MPPSFFKISKEFAAKGRHFLFFAIKENQREKQRPDLCQLSVVMRYFIRHFFGKYKNQPAGKNADYRAGQDI